MYITFFILVILVEAWEPLILKGFPGVIVANLGLIVANLGVIVANLGLLWRTIYIAICVATNLNGLRWNMNIKVEKLEKNMKKLVGFRVKNLKKT